MGSGRATEPYKDISIMDVLRDLILSGVHVFVMGDEEIVQYRFTNKDSPNIGAGEIVVVTIKRQHGRVYPLMPWEELHGVPV